MSKEYYSLEEIKTKFKNYRELKESVITGEEYEMFCGGIMVLPKEIVDRVHKEVQFVLLSAHPKKGNPACYVHLKEVIDDGKEAIIVLTPFIFASFIHENGERKEPEQSNIPHEVAHHILAHYEYKDQQDMEEKEKAAQKQVEEWVKRWAKFIPNE